jgi:hypothetical protein
MQEARRRRRSPKQVLVKRKNLSTTAEKEKLSKHFSMQNAERTPAMGIVSNLSIEGMQEARRRRRRRSPKQALVDEKLYEKDPMAMFRD